MFPFRWPDVLARGELEIGSFLIHQKGLSGESETGYYTPLKWTGFHSRTLDWKFEAGLGYFTRRDDDWRSFIAAPGFRYRIDDATTVTPFARLGLARMKSGGGTMFAYGADVLLQRIFTTDPGAGHGTHRFVVAEAQAGFMAYEGRGTQASTRYGFVVATAAYDWPLRMQGPSALLVRRAKLGLGLESQFGEGRAVDLLFLVNASLRSESPETGRLRHKIDLAAGIGGNGEHRLSFGYTRGF